MAEQKQPSVKDQSETTIPQKVLKFFAEMRADIKTNDIDAIEGWKEKMRIARNMRQGIKRQTDFPYQGAPDIPLPETDKIIKKQKARYVLAVSSGKKLMKVSAQEGIQDVNEVVKEKAKKANLAMNWLFKRASMNWVKKLALAADRFLEKGHAIFKTVEVFDSRIVNKVVDLDEFSEQDISRFKRLPAAQKRDFLANRYGLDPDDEVDAETLNTVLSEFASGKKVIKFATEEVTALPDVLVPLPEKVYVPKGTTDIDLASRVTNEFFWDENKLNELSLNNTIIKSKVDKIIENKQKGIKKGDGDMNEKIKDRLEGIEDNEQGGNLFRIHETITWYQPKKSGRFEKWVFTYFADVGTDEEAIIQYMPYPFEFKGWNYVKHDNEVIDDRYRSARGIPEQIRAIQEFLERSVNNMLIRDEINNAPMFTVKNNAGIVSDSVRFIPGQKIIVNDHSDIEQLNQAISVDVSSERIMQTLKAYAEEYVGLSDQLFRNTTNKAGGKTLGEIQIGVTEAQFSANLDVLIWIDSIRKVYEKVFYILQERLTRPLIINGTSITREDFDFTPEIVVNGALEMADKSLQLQSAQLRLERSIQAKQLGIATSDDIFNAFEDYFEKDGVKEPLDFITKPEEVAKAMITQMENQIQQLQSILQDQQSEISQSDNTLRQITQQINRKSGGDNGKVPGTGKAR